MRAQTRTRGHVGASMLERSVRTLTRACTRACMHTNQRRMHTIAHACTDVCTRTREHAHRHMGSHACTCATRICKHVRDTRTCTRAGSYAGAALEELSFRQRSPESDRDITLDVLEWEKTKPHPPKYKKSHPTSLIHCSRNFPALSDTIIFSKESFSFRSQISPSDHSSSSAAGPVRDSLPC